MRVFIDACVDPKVAELFPGHAVSTAVQLGWHRLPDNEIVRRCVGTFDLLITADKGFEYEHNLRKLTFGIVIVHTSRNKFEEYCRLQAEIIRACRNLRPGSVVHVR